MRNLRLLTRCVCKIKAKFKDHNNLIHYHRMFVNSHDGIFLRSVSNSMFYLKTSSFVLTIFTPTSTYANLYSSIGSTICCLFTTLFPAHWFIETYQQMKIHTITVPYVDCSMKQMKSTRLSSLFHKSNFKLGYRLFYWALPGMSRRRSYLGIASAVAGASDWRIRIEDDCTQSRFTTQGRRVYDIHSAYSVAQCL